MSSHTPSLAQGAWRASCCCITTHLVFRSLRFEDHLRGAPTIMAVERGAFDGARTVPAGAGPDGVKRPRQAMRSIYSRLVVDTSDGPLLFEIGFAKRKARLINETLG